jgi:hypothetical protein
VEQIVSKKSTLDKTLDKKGNPVPGPGSYNLSEVWKGKKLKKRRKKRPYSANPKIGDRILKSISKGPSISIYHSRSRY